MEGKAYVVVYVLAADGGGVRVFDTAEIPDECQTEFDKHCVLLVAINRIG